MAKIVLHAGSWGKCKGESYSGVFVFRTDAHPFAGETVVHSSLESVDVANEENVKKIGGMAGWGVAGAVILGPVGLLAGLLLGGKKKEVTFVAKFKNGRKMIATTTNKEFVKIQSVLF